MSCVFIFADEDAWHRALPSNLNFLPFNEVNENTIGKNCLIKVRTLFIH